MSISAIQTGGVYQAPEIQKAQAPAAAPAGEAKGQRIVPEERAFDRYEPENKTQTTTANTDQVDREIEQLKKRKEQMEKQLHTAEPDQAESIRKQLDQVERELAQKDSDAYRRQHTVFS